MYIIQVVKTYNNEAESASDYYDDYQRIYVVTPLSHTQFNATLHRIKDASDQNDTQQQEAMLEEVSF